MISRRTRAASPARADAVKAQVSVSAGVDLALGLLATGRLHGRRKAPVPAGDAQPGIRGKKDGWAQRVLAEPGSGSPVRE